MILTNDIDGTKEGFDMETKSKFTASGRTKLVSGSILQPELAGLRLIVVPCSATGKPDTNLHKLLDRKWQIVGRDLKGWFAHHIDFKLGSVSTSATQSDTWIVHTLCFDKEGKLDDKALVSCVKKIAALALAEKASVHMSVLVLDAIPSIKDLIAPEFLDKGIHAYFYQEADGSFMSQGKPAESTEVAQEQPVLAEKVEPKVEVVKAPARRIAPVKVKEKGKPKVAKKSVTKAAPASKPAVVAAVKPVSLSVELPEGASITTKVE